MERITYYNNDPNYGWKLHISFDINNSSTVNTIDTFLNKLYSQYGVKYKIGRSSGQSGKEATIYCGSKNNADIIASIILDYIGRLLLDPHGDTLNDDIKFNNKVMGRFTVSQFHNRSNLKHPDPHNLDEFHQYGAQGIPFLNKDMHLRAFQKDKYNKETAISTANKILTDEFGDYYTGAKNRKKSKSSKPKRKPVKCSCKKK